MQKTFKEQIELLEIDESNQVYNLRIGTLHVMLTAVHTMNQKREDGSIKLQEPYTKAIVKYISEKLDTYHYIKLQDTGVESNRLNQEPFKQNLLKYIKEYNIKLVIDIHGAKEERDFDVEFGTLNNLTTDFSTIKELEDAFVEQGVKGVVYNDPFKGGGITQSIYGNTEIDVVQIEINKKFRDLNQAEKLEKICNALINFIKMYTNYVD